MFAVILVEYAAMKKLLPILAAIAISSAYECDAQVAFGTERPATPGPVPSVFRDVGTFPMFDGVAEASGVPVRMIAEVVHISVIREDTCVVVDPERPWEQGIVMTVPDITKIDDGDVVVVDGVTESDGHHLRVRASSTTLVRKVALSAPSIGKFADLRLGKLHARRIALEGNISDIMATETRDGHMMTYFRLNFGHSRASCRVPGRLPRRYLESGDVRVTGCVFNEYNDQGVVVEAFVELEGQSAVEPLSAIYWWRIGAYALAVAVAVLLLVLLAGWIRMRRTMFAERAVSKDRQRMAADLHDTIEQHLAGVKILLTCAMKPAGVPEETKKVLEKAAAMLIHAKGEVRSTIMNLRNAGQEEKGLEAHIKEMATPLRHGGMSVRVLLRGVPAKIDPARFGDLLLIIREAVTNAVKHGKAKTVVIVSDPAPDGGFVLKVLNDGAPFDVNAALGPETGHFGLAGMRERALRSGFTLEFTREGDWTAVKLEVPS